MRANERFGAGQVALREIRVERARRVPGSLEVVFDALADR
jgi:hypothetical protein